jgi:hypothetical protein
LISDDDDFRARGQRVGEQLSNQPLDVRDPNVHGWLTFVRHVSASPAGHEYTAQERDNLRSIVDFLNQRSELADDAVRGFRNTLGALGVLLLVILLITGILAAIAPALFSLCAAATATTATVCPSGSASPGRGDVAGVELMGALGGLISALVFYGQLVDKPNPHLLQLVQALIKLPVGAAVSLTVIELMQQGAVTSLGLLAPQPGARILGLAILFGLAQQVATQALDQYASKLLGVTSTAKPGLPAMSGS